MKNVCQRKPMATVNVAELSEWVSEWVRGKLYVSNDAEWAYTAKSFGFIKCCYSERKQHWIELNWTELSWAAAAAAAAVCLCIYTYSFHAIRDGEVTWKFEIQIFRETLNSILLESIHHHVMVMGDDDGGGGCDGGGK